MFYTSIWWARKPRWANKHFRLSVNEKVTWLIDNYISKDRHIACDMTNLVAHPHHDNVLFQSTHTMTVCYFSPPTPWQCVISVHPHHDSVLFQPTHTMTMCYFSPPTPWQCVISVHSHHDNVLFQSTHTMTVCYMFIWCNNNFSPLVKRLKCHFIRYSKTCSCPQSTDRMFYTIYYYQKPYGYKMFYFWVYRTKYTLLFSGFRWFLQEISHILWRTGNSVVIVLRLMRYYYRLIIAAGSGKVLIGPGLPLEAH